MKGLYCQPFVRKNRRWLVILHNKGQLCRNVMSCQYVIIQSSTTDKNARSMAKYLYYSLGLISNWKLVKDMHTEHNLTTIPGMQYPVTLPIFSGWLPQGIVYCFHTASRATHLLLGLRLQVVRLARSADPLIILCGLGPGGIVVAGLILGLRPANERRRYFVTMSPIGWAQTWNQPCSRVDSFVMYASGKYVFTN